MRKLTQLTGTEKKYEIAENDKRRKSRERRIFTELPISAHSSIILVSEIERLDCDIFDLHVPRVSSVDPVFIVALNIFTGLGREAKVHK